MKRFKKTFGKRKLKWKKKSKPQFVKVSRGGIRL